MFRFAIVVVAVMLMAFQTGPSPRRPQLTPELTALTDDAAAARAFDYMGLKTSGADLNQLAVAVFLRTRPGGAQDARCPTEAEAEIQSSLMAAAAAPDAETFDRDRAAAGEALVKWRAFAQSMAEGHVAKEEPFSWVSERYTGAAAESNPRVRELLMRAAADQLIRRANEGGVQVWGELSPGARSRVDTALNVQACKIDSENTAWLKADVAANGWYLISTTGEAASGAAWLMAQHADRNPAFQKEVLAMLETLVRTGETSPSNYALLWDRVAVSEHRPQRYGTQGRCIAKDVWGPQEVEDLENIDALRAEVELQPLAEYAARLHRYCADFAG